MRVLARQARRCSSPATPASRAPGSRCGCRRLGAEVTGLALPPAGPEPLRAARVWRGWTTAHRRPARRRRRRARRCTRSRPRDRVPPRRAAAGAAQLPRAGRRPSRPTCMGTVNLLEAVRATAERAGVVVNVTTDKCYATANAPQRLPRGRRARRPRSVQRLQGLRRARRGELSQRSFLAAGGVGARDRARRQRRSAAATGRGPAGSRPGARLATSGRRCDPLSAGGPALAARARAARRLPAARRAPARRPARLRRTPGISGPTRPASCSVAEVIVASPAQRRPASALRRRAPPQPHEAGLLRLDSAQGRERLGWRPVWDAGDDARAHASPGTGASTSAARSTAAPTSSATSPMHAAPACLGPSSASPKPHEADTRRRSPACGTWSRAPHRRRARQPDPPVLRRRASRRPARAALRPGQPLDHAHGAARCAACTSSARRTPRGSWSAACAAGLRRRRRPARRLADLPALARRCCSRPTTSGSS